MYKLTKHQSDIIIGFINDNRTVNAIKEFREATGSSLKEALDNVDSYRDRGKWNSDVIITGYETEYKSPILKGDAIETLRTSLCSLAMKDSLTLSCMGISCEDCALNTDKPKEETIKFILRMLEE